MDDSMDELDERADPRSRTTPQRHRVRGIWSAASGARVDIHPSMVVDSHPVP
jgi:hypothetical protein